jgi:hypothetical protein
MFSFSDILLKPGPVANTLAELDITTFYQAVEFVWKLPYGRNTSPNCLLIIKEARGTCSTKHAFLAKLAREQRVDLHLTVGIFMMGSINTPSIARVLDSVNISAIPEAHCYLKSGDLRYDFTHYKEKSELFPNIEILYEESIHPEQIGDYKVTLHQKWILAQTNFDLDFDDLWLIRESCIRELSNKE